MAWVGTNVALLYSHYWLLTSHRSLALVGEWEASSQCHEAVVVSGAYLFWRTFDGGGGAPLGLLPVKARGLLLFGT